MFLFHKLILSPSFLLRKYFNSIKAIVVFKMIRILRFSYNKKRQVPTRWHDQPWQWMDLKKVRPCNRWPSILKKAFMSTSARLSTGCPVLRQIVFKALQPNCTDQTLETLSTFYWKYMLEMSDSQKHKSLEVTYIWNLHKQNKLCTWDLINSDLIVYQWHWRVYGKP